MPSPHSAPTTTISRLASPGGEYHKLEHPFDFLSLPYPYPYPYSHHHHTHNNNLLLIASATTFAFVQLLLLHVPPLLTFTYQSTQYTTTYYQSPLNLIELTRACNTLLLLLGYHKHIFFIPPKGQLLVLPSSKQTSTGRVSYGAFPLRGWPPSTLCYEPGEEYYFMCGRKVFSIRNVYTTFGPPTYPLAHLPPEVVFSPTGETTSRDNSLAQPLHFLRHVTSMSRSLVALLSYQL
ncbi:hypothetical protein F4805DRAFT_305078 [Annulohypoxylon moriforme]|nr:hypothetical protein F4805DRAFT_305078 [Annulohypoxylon moriforme]